MSEIVLRAGQGVTTTELLLVLSYAFREQGYRYEKDGLFCAVVSKRKAEVVPLHDSIAGGGADVPPN